MSQGFKLCLAALSQGEALAAAAAELIEARIYDGSLSSLAAAIGEIDPDWLDRRIERLLDRALTLASEDDDAEMAAAERLGVWRAASYWLEGVEPPARFVLS